MQSVNWPFFLFISTSREITLGQFKELLKAVAGKYQKDKKLDSEEAAYQAMVAAIIEHEPALHGTTVSILKT